MSSNRRTGPMTRREHGAALVEIAIVATALFVLFLGTIDYGVQYRDSLTVNDAVSDAARIGAIVGPDADTLGRNADYQIVQGLREGLAALDDARITRIVVFKSTSSGPPETQVPAACRDGIALAGVCNVYDPTAAFGAVIGGDTDFFTCAGPNTTACPYDPELRSNGPTRSDIETIGVWVRVDQSAITGFFRDTYTVTGASTVRLEPGIFEP